MKKIIYSFFVYCAAASLLILSAWIISESNNDIPNKDGVKIIQSFIPRDSCSYENIPSYIYRRYPGWAIGEITSNEYFNVVTIYQKK